MREHFTYRVLLDQFAIADDRPQSQIRFTNVHFVGDHRIVKPRRRLMSFSSSRIERVVAGSSALVASSTQQYFGIAG